MSEGSADGSPAACPSRRVAAYPRRWSTFRFTRRRRSLEHGLALLVELELVGIDQDVCAREVAELADLRPASTRPAPGRAGRRRRSRGCPASAIASIAASVASVGASSSGVSASIRATSSATLPLPITTARSCERSNSRSWKSGWPLYQATNSRGRPRAGQVLAGDPEPAVGLRADRVDAPRRRARASSSCVTSTPSSTLPKKRKPGSLRGPLERARDLLQLRVVGRDAETDETPRRRQPFEHVDLGGRVGAEQRARSVEPRRAGADDRDAKWTVIVHPRRC